MPWNDVLDPEKGYIKDDTITLEVREHFDFSILLWECIVFVIF